MKIALCYFGVLRSFNKVLESHETHIYEVFKKNNIDFDIFIHTWTGKYVNSCWDYFIDFKNDTSILDKLKLKLKQIDDQDETFLNKVDQEFFSEWYNLEKFEKYGDSGEWYPKLFKNMICGLESQKRTVQLALSTNIDYDFYIMIRPDYLMLSDFNIDVLNIKGSFVIVPNNEHHLGYNDRIAICTPDTIKTYSFRIDRLKDYKKNNRAAPETYLKYILDSTNTTVKLITFIDCTPIRPNGIHYNQSLTNFYT